MPDEFKFKLGKKTYTVIDWANVYGWFSDPTSKNYLGWEIDPKKLFEYLKSYPEISEVNLYYGVESAKSKSVDFKNEVEAIGYNNKSKEVKWVPAALETTAHFKPLVRKLFDVLDNVKNTNSTISIRLYELSRKVEQLSKISIETSKPIFNITDEGQLKEIYDAIEALDIDLKKLNIDIGALQEQLKQPVNRRKCDFDVEISRDIYNNLQNFEILIIFSGDGDYAALVDDLIKKGKRAIIVFGFGHIGKEYNEIRNNLIKSDIKGRLFLCTVDNLREFIEKQKNIPEIAPGA